MREEPRPPRDGARLEIELFRDYAAAFERSSKRGRFVLLVMQLTSIAAFVVFWNHIEFGWTHARLQHALGELVKWHVATTRAAEDAALAARQPGTGPPRWPRAASGTSAIQGRADAPGTSGPGGRAGETARDTLDSDSGVRREGGLDTEIPADLRTEIWRGELDTLNAIKLSNITTVRIPFLGIVFDVNDLGLIVGLAFVTTLMWFRYACDREQHNLKLALRAARSLPSFRRGYEILAMTQVLTIPPGSSTGSRWSRYVLVLLFFVPAVLFLAIVGYDVYSISIANDLSPAWTTVGLSVRGVCLVAIWYFTIKALLDQRAMLRLWKSAGRRASAEDSGRPDRAGETRDEGDRHRRDPNREDPAAVDAASGREPGVILLRRAIRRLREEGKPVSVVTVEKGGAGGIVVGGRRWMRRAMKDLQPRGADEERG